MMHFVISRANLLERYALESEDNTAKVRELGLMAPNHLKPNESRVSGKASMKNGYVHVGAMNPCFAIPHLDI